MKRKLISIFLTFALTVGLFAGCADKSSNKRPVVSKTTAASQHQHTFAEATCTEPKTCTECGEAEGKALGHLVDIGFCDRCDTFQNMELVMEISDLFTDISEATTTASSIIESVGNESSSNDIYIKLNDAQKYINEAKIRLQSIYDLCEGHPNLKKTQNTVKYTLDAVPGWVQGSDYNSITSYIADCIEFYEQLNACRMEFLNFLNEVYSQI